MFNIRTIAKKKSPTVRCYCLRIPEDLSTLFVPVTNKKNLAMKCCFLKVFVLLGSDSHM